MLSQREMVVSLLNMHYPVVSAVRWEQISTKQRITQKKEKERKDKVRHRYVFGCKAAFLSLRIHSFLNLLYIVPKYMLCHGKTI